MLIKFKENASLQQVYFSWFCWPIAFLRSLKQSNDCIDEKLLDKVTGYEILEDCKNKKKTIFNKCIEVIRIILASAFVLNCILIVTSSCISGLDMNQTLWVIKFQLIILFCLFMIALHEFDS